MSPISTTTQQLNYDKGRILRLRVKPVRNKPTNKVISALFRLPAYNFDVETCDFNFTVVLRDARYIYLEVEDHARFVHCYFGRGVFTENGEEFLVYSQVYSGKLRYRLQCHNRKRLSKLVKTVW